ncbi:VOC family protein [Sinomonas flava]|uniref:VOC family protein n=1 Tax=Sinomonas flava TaxID=496857 RepID=UPI0039A4C491
MLRVRPTRYTSAMPELRRLLEDVGLVVTEEGSGWAVLDAGSGRVRLRAVPAGSPGDGMTSFGVEIREPEAFTRRTRQDGGRASIEDAIGGLRVRITGPDGFSFLAEPSAHGATCADADRALAVRMEWLTPDLPGAALALSAIGARPRTAGAPGPATEFTAKNGGVLALREAPVLRGGDLVLEYDGDVGTLASRLARAGWSPEVGEAQGRQGAVVRVPTPDGGEVTILTAPPGHGVEQ